MDHRASLGLFLLIMMPACLGAAHGRLEATDASAGTPTATSMSGSVTGAPGTPTPSPGARPVPGLPPPTPHLLYQAPAFDGPVAIEFTFTLHGSYACHANTTFASRDQPGILSRHQMFLGEGAHMVRADDLVVDNPRFAFLTVGGSVDTRPWYDSTVWPAMGHGGVQNNSFRFSFGSPPTPSDDGEVWTYLVAARNVTTGHPLRLEIECDHALTVRAIKAAHQVWLENAQALSATAEGGAAVGTVGAKATLTATTNLSAEWHAASAYGAFSLTLQTPGGAHTWLSSPAAAGGLDYWDLADGPGTYSLEASGAGASFSFLLAGMQPVASLPAMDAYLQAPR